MTIVQDAFSIPDDIATGLATGLYRRIGGVVRYATGPNKGQIVKLLEPVDLKATEQVQGIGTKVLQFFVEHKKGVAIVAAGTVAMSGAILIYNKVKNHEPKVVSEYKASLRVYIDAIREGNMDVNIINNLLTNLEKLKEHKDYRRISIQLTTEDLEVLVNRIYDYTLKLAKDNEFDLTDEELQIYKAENTGTIINLQNCLMAQKRIFELVA